MTEDKRTINDLLRERHARGALDGRIRPDGHGGLIVDRPGRPRRTATDGRQVTPANPSMFDRPAPDEGGD